MHLDSQGVVTVLGHAACITPLSLGDLKLPGLSVVDELDAYAQVALCPVLGSHLHSLPVQQLEPAHMCKHFRLCPKDKALGELS